MENPTLDCATDNNNDELAAVSTNRILFALSQNDSSLADVSFGSGIHGEGV